jgi:hypothetical protein
LWEVLSLIPTENMSVDDDGPAMRALKRKIDKLMDPLHVELLSIGGQTLNSNHDMLYDWSKGMRYHESKSTRLWERVYLVVSDLKLMLASRHKLEKALDNKSPGPLVSHSGVFLNPKEIDGLREKHWAIEVDGAYYELDRDKRDQSFFSSRRRVGHFDRRIAARIFLGTTHFERRALQSIGGFVHDEFCSGSKAKHCMLIFVDFRESSDRNAGNL